MGTTSKKEVIEDLIKERQLNEELDRRVFFKRKIRDDIKNIREKYYQKIKSMDFATDTGRKYIKYINPNDWHPIEKSFEIYVNKDELWEYFIEKWYTHIYFNIQSTLSIEEFMKAYSIEIYYTFFICDKY